MVQTDTYAKLLTAISSLCILSFLFGVIIYIIVRSSPYWITSWYTRHINAKVGYTTVKRNLERVGACFIVGAVIILFIIEMFSQLYLEKRRKSEFILAHLEMQLENMKSEI